MFLYKVIYLSAIRANIAKVKARMSELASDKQITLDKLSETDQNRPRIETGSIYVH